MSPMTGSRSFYSEPVLLLQSESDHEKTVRSQCGRFFFRCETVLLYSTPCAIMASATFVNPAMLAPMTKFFGWPKALAVADMLR